MNKEILTIKVTLQSETIPGDKLAAALVDINGPLTAQLYDWLKDNLPRFVKSEDFNFGVETKPPKDSN